MKIYLAEIGPLHDSPTIRQAFADKDRAVFFVMSHGIEDQTEKFFCTGCWYGQNEQIWGEVTAFLVEEGPPSTRDAALAAAAAYRLAHDQCRAAVTPPPTKDRAPDA